MYTYPNLLLVDLHLFDGAAAGTSGTADTGTSDNSAVGTQQDGSDSRQKGKKSKAAAVVYGKQAEPDAPKAVETEAPQDTSEAPKGETEVKTTSDTLEARRAEFEKLIKEDYKNEFTERTQQIIDRRFAETKGYQEQLEAAKPILDVLSAKYNVKPDDIEGLVKAIETDDTYWEEEADKAGVSVEQFKYIKQLERENAEIQKFKAQQEDAQRTQQILADWQKQADAVMPEAYPDFSLQTELENDEFTKLLTKGVDVKTAYEVIHMGEIKTNVAQSTAKSVEQNVVNNIRAKGTRPTENGASPQGGVIVKSDVSKLTKHDREEIARRAMRGETIRF